VEVQNMATNETNYDRLFQNVNKGIEAGLQYVPADRHKRVVLSAYGSFNKPKTTRSNEINPSLVELNDAINKIPALPLKNGVINMGGTTIWSFLNPVSNADPYSDYRFDAQRHIETFRHFAERTRTLKNARFFGLDIETLGDTASDKFFVSEISANAINMRSGKVIGESKRLRFNRLIRPDEIMQRELNHLIYMYRTGRFHELNPSQQRTLVDLIRYSSIAEEGYTAASFGKEVRHNSLIHSVLHGKEIQQIVLSQDVNRFVRHMRSGLQNLIANGAGYEEVINEYNEFLSRHRNSYFVTMNGDRFDLPTLQRWADRVGLKIQGPKYHMDYQAVMQSIIRNPIDLHDIYGRTKDMPFVEGPWTLQEWRRTLGLDTGDAHAASADTGMHWVGGVVANTWEYFDRMLPHMEVNERYKARKLGQRFPYLMYSNQPLTTNDLLFATRAVSNYKGSHLDYMAELAEDGTYRIFRPGFNQNVINAESFYRVAGIRDLSSGGIPRWAIEFVNADNPTLRSFVVREGENAAYEIADFYHRSFMPVSNLSKKMRKMIEYRRESDLARRRYENLFSLDDSATKGFRAARRMYANAAVYEKFAAGRWSAIEAEASRRLDELTIKNGQFIRHWTPEKYEQAREKIIGRLLKKRINKDEMRELMDFNSLWDSVSKTWVYNEAEERAFWRMLPRLMSERQLYQSAIDAIDKSGLDEQKKSVAWALFHEQVKEIAGDHKEIREPLPYEQRGFTFRDRITGKSRNVTLQNVNYTINQLSSYVNSDTADLSESEKLVVREERFKTLLASLNDSGIIEDEYMQNLIRDYHGRNLTIPQSIQILALDLMENQRLMMQNITEQSLRKRESVERISKQAGHQMIQSVIGQARGMQGYLIDNGFVVRPDLSQGDIGEIFNQLDRRHPITGLNPNNRKAVEQIISHLNQINPGMQTVLSMNREGTQAIITMFNKEDSMSVMRHLISGSNEAHPKAFEMVVPLVSRQGTLVYGNQHLNAVTDVIRINRENRQISSVEKLAMMLTDPKLMAENDQWNYRNMVEAIQKGEFEEANKLARRLVRNQVTVLSGVKRDLDDDLKVRRNESDLAKQSRVYAHSAMIQDYYERGLISDDDFYNKEVILNADKKKLHPFVSLEDLSDEARFMIRKDLPQWAKANGIGNLFYSAVKSDVVIDGGASRMDARDLIPYGHFTNMGRDNAVQIMNSYAIDRDLENILNESSAWISTEPMVKTKLQDRLDQVLPYKREVHVKTALMSQAQVDEAIQRMMETEEGRRILRSEGIIDVSGNINPVRYPNVYEQQALMNRDLVNRFKMKNYKIYRGDEIYWDEKFIDADGNLRTNIDILPGERLGYRIIDGRREDVFYDQRHVGRIASEMSDNAFAIEYKEQANKFTFDIEKTTIGGGQLNGEFGYGQRFLEELTGVEGIGAVYNPDIAKHRDFGGALRAQANKLKYYVDQMSEEDKKRAVAMINRGRVGLKATINADGTVELLDVTKVNKYRSINVENFYKLFEQLGISETSEQGVVWGIQAMRAAQVQTYSTMVDGKRKAILNYDISDDGRMVNIVYNEGEVKGVKYGFRELGMLKQKGYNHTFDYIWNHMKTSARETGRAQEAISMVHALRGLVYGEQAVDPDFEKRTVRLGDLLPLPTTDTNRATIYGTILDDDYLRSLVEDNDYHGYWLELPHAEISGQKTPLTVNVDGRQINRIFVPFMKNEGKGNEIWKREMQQHIADIYRRAAEVGKAGTDIERQRAMERLQRSVNSYVEGLVKHVTASKGQTGESVFKTNMPFSSSGLTKVLPTSISSQLGGEHVFISPDEARALGVYDHIVNGKDFYVVDVRYPTFTDKAVQVARLKVSENVATGQHHVTSLLAKFLAADSDGDYNQLLAIHDEKVQEELEQRYKAEEYARRQRHEAAYQRALANSEEYPSDYIEGFMKKAVDGEKERRFGLRDLAGESGRIEAIAPNQIDEMLAKSGKELVGQASDLNYMMRQIANHYYADNEAARQAIFNLGEGLEQKLTISSKHGTGQVLMARSGASELLEAIRYGNWKEAIDIDKRLFEGRFAKEYDLEMAAGHLQEAMKRMKEDFKNVELRAGTSRGMRLSDHGLTKIVDTIMGKNPDMTGTNQYMGLLQRLLREEAGLDIQYPEPMDITPEYRKVSPLEPGLDSMMAKRLEGPAGTIAEIIEDGTGGMLGPKTYNKVSQSLDAFFNGPNGPRNKKAALIGGLALAGIIGYNTLNDSEPVMPYNSDYQSAEQARAHASMMYGGTPMPAITPIDAGFSGANITISAQGKGSQNFGPMIGQALQQSGYNGKVQMNVNHSDNTAHLSRIWYRDKVEQYS
jgi:hypothetical protein